MQLDDCGWMKFWKNYRSEFLLQVLDAADGGGYDGDDDDGDVLS